MITLSYTDAVALSGVTRGELREAASAQERWARNALVALTQQCDGAVTDDAVGFNKADTNVGRYLGHYVEQGGLFDDTEWRAAVGLCRKYHEQVGACPPADEHDRAVDARLADAVADLRQRAKTVSAAERAELARREAAAERERERAERAEREAAERERRANAPEITIEVSEDGERLLVRTPYNADATAAWRAIPSRRWNTEHQGNVISKAHSRELHALLVQHYSGKRAIGPKGPFVVGGAQ